MEENFEKLQKFIESKLDETILPIEISNSVLTEKSGFEEFDLIPFVERILDQYNDEDAHYTVEALDEKKGGPGIKINIKVTGQRRASVMYKLAKAKADPSKMRRLTEMNANGWIKFEDDEEDEDDDTSNDETETPFSTVRLNRQIFRRVEQGDEDEPKKPFVGYEGAGVIVCNTENEILFLVRGTVEDGWRAYIPSGKPSEVDKGEWGRTAIRNLRQEAGLALTDDDMQNGLYTLENANAFPIYHYLSKPIDKTPVDCGGFAFTWSMPMFCKKQGWVVAYKRELIPVGKTEAALLDQNKKYLDRFILKGDDIMRAQGAQIEVSDSEARAIELQKCLDAMDISIKDLSEKKVPPVGGSVALVYHQIGLAVTDLEELRASKAQELQLLRDPEKKWEWDPIAQECVRVPTERAQGGGRAGNELSGTDILRKMMELEDNAARRQERIRLQEDLNRQARIRVRGELDTLDLALINLFAEREATKNEQLDVVINDMKAEIQTKRRELDLLRAPEHQGKKWTALKWDPIVQEYVRCADRSV